jgi:hypothetical protein
MTRKEEKLMWQTYWRLRFNPNKICTEKERQIYNKAGYLLVSEVYTSNKATEGFRLPTFQRLMHLLCKRH